MPVCAGAWNRAAVDLPGAVAASVDITDPSSVLAAAELAGDVTILINNAGSSSGAGLLQGDLDSIRLEMETHFFGTLAMVRAFAPKIAANGGGAILNVLSALSWVSYPSIGAYCAAKAAEWSMTNAIRVELAEQSVRVAGLHVGYMDTDLAASWTGPKSDPAEIATIALDGIEAGQYEILADESARRVMANLSGGVAAFYPQLIAGPIVHFREVMPQLQRRLFGRFIARNLMVGLVIFALLSTAV